MPGDAMKQDTAMTDPAEVMAALLRAARRAHEIARAIGTRIIVWMDGRTRGVKTEPSLQMFGRFDPGGRRVTSVEPAAEPRLRP